jgi:hypothetical protein
MGRGAGRTRENIHDCGKKSRSYRRAGNSRFDCQLFSQAPPELKSKLDSKIKQLESLTDPHVVTSSRESRNGPNPSDIWQRVQESSLELEGPSLDPSPQWRVGS